MSGYAATVPLLFDTGVIGGINADVIAPPPGERSPETNDNSVAILLSCGEARILLAADAEARKSTWLKVRTRDLKRSSTFRNYIHSEPRFRTLLTEGDALLSQGVRLAW